MSPKTSDRTEGQSSSPCQSQLLKVSKWGPLFFCETKEWPADNLEHLPDSKSIWAYHEDVEPAPRLCTRLAYDTGPAGKFNYAEPPRMIWPCGFCSQVASSESPTLFKTYTLSVGSVSLQLWAWSSTQQASSSSFIAPSKAYMSHVMTWKECHHFVRNVLTST